MPSKSKAQRNYIFYLRGKYKNKSNTPEKDQWIWNDEWKQVEEAKNDNVYAYSPKIERYIRKYYESTPQLKDIYTLQSYFNPHIVNQKRKEKDYEIQVSKYKDDGKDIWILVDGNHSYKAALLDHVKPIIKIVPANFKYDLEQYVIAFNDLSNPVNIVSGKELW